MTKIISVFAGMRDQTPHPPAQKTVRPHEAIGDGTIHPVIQKLVDLAIPDDRAARILDVSVYELHRARQNPDEASQYITTDKILNFCHELGIHPALLSPPNDNFLQTPPSEIIQANIWILQTSGYGEQDKLFAQMALDKERQRYTAFMNDPYFGRLGEEISDATGNLAPSEYAAILSSVLPYKPENLFHILFSLHDRNLSEQKSALQQGKTDAVKATIHSILDMFSGMERTLGSDYKIREVEDMFSRLCRDYRADRPLPTEKEICRDMGVYCSQRIMSGINRVYSTCDPKMEKRKTMARHSFLLEGDIMPLATAFREYLRTTRNSSTRLESFRKTEELLEDSLGVINQWKTAISDPSGRQSHMVRVIERLIANQALIHQAASPSETVEEKFNDLWNSLSATHRPA